LVSQGRNLAAQEMRAQDLPVANRAGANPAVVSRAVANLAVANLSLVHPQVVDEVKLSQQFADAPEDLDGDDEQVERTQRECDC